MKLVIIHFSLVSCYFLCARSENLSRLLVLKHPVIYGMNISCLVWYFVVVLHDISTHLVNCF